MEHKRMKSAKFWLQGLITLMSLQRHLSALEVPAEEPEVTALKCFGSEQEVKVGETTIKKEGFCRSTYGGNEAKEGGEDGECKEIDCLAMAKNRLSADSKDYPRSCFSQSINQFDGKYSRLHACGPDRGEVIPYSIMKQSFDESSGLDNGFLRRLLQEDCRVFEIHKSLVGLKRVCTMDATAGQCAIKYVAPGTQGEKLEKLMLEGAVLCPGHYVCRPETDTDPDDGPLTYCVCEPGFKTCRLEITLDSDSNELVRGCTQQILKKSEIGPQDAVCDFATELKDNATCSFNITNGCQCPAREELLNLGSGNHTLTAHCSRFPSFKNAIMKTGMKDFCRKKTRTVDGVWFPVGYEAGENSLCYCNKDGSACNGTPFLFPEVITAYLSLMMII